MNYENLKARWPKDTPAILGAIRHKRKDYGVETPVKPLLSRISGAISRQFDTDEDRAEALAPLGVCVVIIIATLVLWLSLPGAVGEMQGHSRAVVSEIREEQKP